MYATTPTRRQAQPILLSEALAEIMDQRHTGVSKRYEIARQLSELWTQILPPELVQHCRVVDVSQGALTVEADSPSYMYELRISSHQLIGHLRRGCPAAKLRTIKITLPR